MLIRALVLALTLGGAAHGLESDNKDPVVKDFNQRVERYWSIHKKAEDTAPKIDKKKEDPHDLLAHETALAESIRAARQTAAEGDVFTPPAQKLFRATIRQQLASGGRGAEAREMILGEGNPKGKEPAGVPLEVKVNAKYPPKAPLSTVPPSVLLALPKLPDGLQYRFIGKHLILFDSKANLIVDILRNAIK